MNSLLPCGLASEASIISNQNIDSLKLGYRIQNCRLASGLTQQEFSEQVGISVHYLSDIERGVRVPKLDTFVKIANVLNVSSDLILQESLNIGYKEKASELQNMIDNLSHEDQDLVFRYTRLLIDSLHK